jgi:rare lipoprotein A (peptidoglycan hydrolase)
MNLGKWWNTCRGIFEVNWNEIVEKLVAAFLATMVSIHPLPQTEVPTRPEIAVPTPPVHIVSKSTPVLVSTKPGGSAWKKDPEVSWYGPNFYGKRTACGLALTKELKGVAHRSLPCGTLVEFRYGGRHIVVPVVDRGPYVSGRTWDLTGGLCVFLRHCFTGPIDWRFT